MTKVYVENRPDYWNFGKLRFDTLKSNKTTELILKYLSKNDVAIEAGCGIGLYNFYLSKQGYNVYGLDFSQKLINECKQNAKKSSYCNPNKFIFGNILDMPFANEKFDVYLSFGVIEHFKSKDQINIIKEAKRILKKRGKVIITVPNLYSPFTLVRPLMSAFKKIYYGKPMVYQKNISPNKLKKMFEKEGFKIMESFAGDIKKSFSRVFLTEKKRVLGLLNPFYFIRKIIYAFADLLEKVIPIIGETSFYVGLK